MLYGQRWFFFYIEPDQDWPKKKRDLVQKPIAELGKSGERKIKYLNFVKKIFFEKLTLNFLMKLETKETRNYAKETKFSKETGNFIKETWN